MRPLRKGNLAQQRLDKKQDVKKIVEYVISILHQRPEFGENSEFVSTYYAKERTSARKLRRVFSKAFKTAHPSWIIKEIVVSPTCTDTTRASSV